MSWEAVELSDLVEIMHQGINTAADKVNYADIGVPIIQAKHLKSNDIDFYDVKFLGSEDYEKYKSKYIPQKGDLLFSNIGTIGKSVIVGVCEDFMFAWNVFLIRVKHEQLDVSYLKYYFDYLLSINYYDRFLTGGTVKFVNKKTMGAIKLPLPPLDEQKRIAAILDKADAIRQKRKHAIALADEFLHSVFLDMFGDPVTNPKGWEVKNLSDFYVDPKNGTKCGPFGSALKKEEFVETGIPVWNMDNISLKGVFFDSPKLWITPEKYEEISSYSVEQGDVIISRAGTVGKMGVVRSVHERSLISTNLIRVRFSEQLLPEYFVALMTYCRGRVGRLKTGPDGSFTHMNTGILDKLEFPYPPLPLQQKFVQILDDVNAYLEKQEDKKIETLFASLSQKAFSGQL